MMSDLSRDFSQRQGVAWLIGTETINYKFKICDGWMSVEFFSQSNGIALPTSNQPSFAFLLLYGESILRPIAEKTLGD
jgi:hypothetical protein